MALFRKKDNQDSGEQPSAGAEPTTRQPPPSGTRDAALPNLTVEQADWLRGAAQTWFGHRGVEV